ncbi:MAG TPA: phosphate acyltransferase PlsX [Roseiflexaceae bacterium]|nr:phosphate acyltransferase PlsX [Roseiflexaceae bacterium]
MRIVLDAAGGDHAPEQPVRGAVLAARELGCEIILVGPEAAIRAELAKHRTDRLRLHVLDAPEVIEMDEHPAQAVRRKTRSSHVIGLRMVRDGAADAFVSAGHSGATMAAATLILGRVRGIERPALAILFPSREGMFLLLDIGATTDCKPEYLAQFAQMGSLYAERGLGIARPRVALLANGEEATKGDRLVQEAHKLLRDSSLNFIGNAEPKDALSGSVCDVLVCDGFVGNMFIKQAQAVVRLSLQLVRDEAGRGLPLKLLPALLSIGGMLWFGREGLRQAGLLAVLGLLVAAPALLGSLVIPALTRVRRKADYRFYGGGPLLGVKGVAIIAHGKSDAAAIASAIRQAVAAVERGAVIGMADLIAPEQELALASGAPAPSAQQSH